MSATPIGRIVSWTQGKATDVAGRTDPTLCGASRGVDDDHYRQARERHMAEATEIPSFQPSSEWYADWPFGVDTFVRVEACVTGSAADRAVEAFLEPLTHVPGADGAGCRRPA